MLFAAFLDPRYKKHIDITDADLDAFQNKVKTICQESASVVPSTESQELVAIESSSVLTTISTTTSFSKNRSTTTSSTPSTSRASADFMDGFYTMYASSDEEEEITDMGELATKIKIEVENYKTMTRSTKDQTKKEKKNFQSP